jgi:hypothetical protein
VDLPGVRDANAARAKVSEQYLQNCSQLWIVAPIKRAVDDGTAKELMGENFKRRLLMDGQYSNISFICTQTDDCETSETMADHEDEAIRLGLWEEMNVLANLIRENELKLQDKQQDEEALQFAYDDLKDQRGELAEEEDDEETSHLVEELRRKEADAFKELSSWRKSHEAECNLLEREIQECQIKLKTMCASVRNEYSKKCLQDDFRSGLDELINGHGDEEVNGDTPSMPAVPVDYKLDVFCVSANDYLKLKRIKTASDGAPSTFSDETQTQIPALRTFVHSITATARTSFTEDYVDSTCNILDRMKLVASNASGVGVSGRMSRRFKACFDDCTADVLGKQVRQIVDEFKNKAGKYDTILQAFSSYMNGFPPAMQRNLSPKYFTQLFKPVPTRAKLQRQSRSLRGHPVQSGAKQNRTPT